MKITTQKILDKSVKIKISGHFFSGANVADVELGITIGFVTVINSLVLDVLYMAGVDAEDGSSLEFDATMRSVLDPDNHAISLTEQRPTALELMPIVKDSVEKIKAFLFSELTKSGVRRLPLLIDLPDTAVLNMLEDNVEECFGKRKR